MLYADSLGFLAAPGEPPVVKEKLVLDLIHLTAVPPWLTMPGKTLAAVLNFIGQIAVPGGHVLVRTKADLERPGLKIVLGLQNPLEPGADLDAFTSAGLRVMQLAYLKSNCYGGGCGCSFEPLTQEGQRLIRRMADCGIILDLSHAGHRTAREALQFIKSRGIRISVMISHTGCYRVFPHGRNLPDDVLRGVAELGGVVGIFGVTFFLHQTDNDVYQAFQPHLIHAAKTCGRDQICVGTDMPYITETAEAGERRFRDMNEKLDPDGFFNARYPDYLPELNGPDKISVLARYCDMFEVQPDGVWGENLVSFFRRALPN